LQQGVFVSDTLVFTIIGTDRPGLVEKISQIVDEHDANWLGSRMGHLGGKFAGMIEVAGEKAQLEHLKVALGTLAGLSVVVEEGVVAERKAGSEKSQRLVTITMLGLDRTGIVKEVSGALAKRNLNVLDLQTSITQAAMTGRPMFNGTAVVACTEGTDLGDLNAELDVISSELGVDIELGDD
jgi:glycine cleavage system regulatory protein